MKRLPKKHINRLEKMLRHLRDAEAVMLIEQGQEAVPRSMRAVWIKEAESIEAALIWIANAKAAP